MPTFLEKHADLFAEKYYISEQRYSIGEGKNEYLPEKGGEMPSGMLFSPEKTCESGLTFIHPKDLKKNKRKADRL